MKKYFGRGRSETLDWLVRVWLHEGPPVCFLDGFPGVGKTDLALELLGQAERQGKWEHAVIDEIGDRSRSVTENLMEFSSRLSREGIREMEEVLWLQERPMLGHAFEKVLQRPVVIVMDQAQRLLVPDRGDPLPELVGILDYLRNRRTLRGRLLLLSDRDVTKAKWSEWVHKRTLKELKLEEAVAMFDARLAEEANSSSDIPKDRKLRALQILHYNPRAIEALVARMRTRSLDAIMADDPGRWATEDASIDPGFLRNLERDLLKQTMEELKERYQRKLWRLSVYRYNNFQEEALQRLGGTAEETEDFRQQLFSRFFLNYHRGTLSMNPIVREISLSHLKSEPAEVKQAHSAAAEYYSRFFNAKRILGSQSKLSEQYGELRYHLFNADRQDDLVAINRRYTEHLRQEIKAETPVPTQRQELDDRIEVLTRLLQEAGSKSLEYHLARCLEVRNVPGDGERALVHAERSADGDRHEDHWVLYATLTRQVQGDGKAIQVILHGLRTLAEMGAKAIVAPLYRLGAEILSESGKTNEAIGLLRDGIRSIPSENNLFSLFELSAEISCRRRKPKEAIQVLREGIWRIEQRFGQQRLMVCALLLSAAFETPANLEEILLLPGKLGYSYATALSRVLVCEMEGDWAGAAKIARSARKDFEKEIGLATHEALSLLAINDNHGARRALTSFHNFTLSEGSVGGWLEALIEVRSGNNADAQRSLELFLNREVDVESELNVEFLLRLWDEQEGIRHQNRLCFNLPILPSSLTGFSHSVRRLQFTDPVLPSRSRVRPPQHLGGLHGSAATIYVSYAWGDDESETGRRREEIVEDLCRAVRASGRQVHRDKTKTRAGSSIDAFAREIAAADRIIAVLSEKSLLSEWCMARELFRAYQRCGFHREEFQQKVIAVVMDDARPYLKDRAAWAGLARHWKEQVSTVSEKLTAVDARRVNEHVWHQGNLLEDMVERLPGMLEALCDTKMEQDLQVLAANEFWDVVSRLP